MLNTKTFLCGLFCLSLASPLTARADNEDEIRALKRRLAELEAKSKAKPAQKAAPPRKAAPVKTAPAKLPVAARRALYVTGRVLTMAGKPISGAEISIYGTTARGDRSRFEASSGANGLFSQRVPDGIYGVGAQHKTTYNGKNYLFYLSPEDGKTGVVHDAAPGIVKNFRWKISGLKPGERAGEPGSHTEGNKYYGGYISLSAGPSPTTENYINFPRGSTLIMTLTPRAKLIDGRTGTVKTYRRTFEADQTSGRYFSWYLENVPVGLYTLSSTLKLPNGTTQPLRVKKAIPFADPYRSSVPVDFEPTQFGDLQMIQITVEPLFLPGS